MFVYIQAEEKWQIWRNFLFARNVRDFLIFILSFRIKREKKEDEAEIFDD